MMIEIVIVIVIVIVILFTNRLTANFKRLFVQATT